ncbi:leucine-rich repeats and immunoglobulin-like domains protein 3 [Argopecten irradians]|uniref:leucine-rich repeats and immunoglobulin-like domains protein 3 n=1 Tax=Argopecten irradians TaxID=31199 RepID=UPI00370FE164
MLKASLLLPLMCISIFAYEFRCPQLEQTTSCKCRGTFEWWNNRNVSILNCSAVSLQTIPNLYGDQSSYAITKLFLNGNNLTRIKANEFLPLQQVNEIDLSRNLIETLENDSLSLVSRHLTRLVLEGNRIALDQGLWFLRGLQTLNELVLDSNTIQNEYHTLPGILFRDLQLTSLRKLSIKNCGISKVTPTAFLGLDQVEELDLSYNYLESVPEAIMSMKRLKKLVLYDNNIDIVSGHSFRGLSHLSEIDMSLNMMTNIEDDAFEGLEDSLKELKLYSNMLSAIPSSSLRKLRKLHFLVLSKNNIHFIQDNAFNGIPNLKMLELDYNPLIYYNEMFSGLEDTLETLTLRATKLTSFPVNALINLRKLTDLDLSLNQITKPVGIGRLALKNLALARNNIVSVSPLAFSGLSRSLSLDLDNNNITNISFLLDVTPCSFSYLDLVGNPVRCDCDTERIINSGMILGIGGTCSLSNGLTYELNSGSTSGVIQHLTQKCNTTEKTLNCVNMQFLSTSSAATPQTTFVFIFVVALLFVTVS